jgi:transposase
MLHVGLDVHARRSSGCILDEHGKIVNRFEVRGSPRELVERVGRIGGEKRICFEASCGYGYLFDGLSGCAQQVQVAHPGRLRLIWGQKRKNDRIDAEKLAKLLYLDAVPRMHVPSADVRCWRGLIEFRQKVMGKRVAVKNQLRALARTIGCNAPRGLFTKKGLAWLGEQPFAPLQRLQIELLLEELSELSGKIRRIEKELSVIAESHAGVQLLMTIPGVGLRTAETFCAYIDQVRRFGSSRQVGAYIGLVPCQDSSGGKDRFGHITRDGPATLRKLLCEAAWIGVRHDARLKSFFERVMGADPDRKKIALVATARYLACVMAAMLRSGEVWRGSAKPKTGQDGLRPAAQGAPPRKTPDR